RFAAMPNRLRAQKLADLVAHGAGSGHVPVALEKLASMCARTEAALANGPWLMGEAFTLADTLLPAYFYRIDCIGLAALWESRFPRTTDWYSRVTARPSMEAAVGPYIDAVALQKMGDAGRAAFLDDPRLMEYFTP
ncbi:MAG: glutathione binding-like protein, partial [Pseudomonadota bacterium]